MPTWNAGTVMTEELRMWSVGDGQKAEPLLPLKQMPTELEFEELLVANPEILEPGLRLQHNPDVRSRLHRLPQGYSSLGGSRPIHLPHSGLTRTNGREQHSRGNAEPGFQLRHDSKELLRTQRSLDHAECWCALDGQDLGWPVHTPPDRSCNCAPRRASPKATSRWLARL